MYVSDTCMHVCMDGWMDGWMNGWMNGWMCGCVSVCMCVCVDGCWECTRVRVLHTSECVHVRAGVLCVYMPACLGSCLVESGHVNVYIRVRKWVAWLEWAAMPSPACVYIAYCC